MRADSAVAGLAPNWRRGDWNRHGGLLRALPPATPPPRRAT